MTELDDSLDNEYMVVDPQPTATPLIVMVEDEPALTRAIVERLTREGRDARLCSDADAERALSDPTADTVVVIDLGAGQGAVSPALAKIYRTDPLAAPLIYVSSRDDMAARLLAHRVGATRYLTHPVDMDRLMLLVDAYLLRLPERPCRVLLVETDADRLERHAAGLKSAGMEVEAVGDPLQAHAAAVRFRPECLVLQREMATCSGDELVAVLRADARFFDTPIVFLMSSADEARPLPQREGGGESCLPESAAPRVLIAAITLRVKRARSLRRLNEDLRAALRESRLLRLAMDVHALVCITDAAGVIAYVNDAFCRASGYRRRELLGQDFSMLRSEAHPPAFFSALWQTLSRGEVWQGQFCNRRKDGSLYWVDTSIVPSMDEGTRPTRYLAVGTDITRLKALEARLQAAEPPDGGVSDRPP